MKITVKLFAAGRELAGASEVLAELPDGANVGALRAWLETHYPSLGPLLKSTAFAVNADYASDHTPLDPSAEVAMIPPVSGG